MQIYAFTPTLLPLAVSFFGCVAIGAARRFAADAVEAKKKSLVCIVNKAPLVCKRGFIVQRTSLVCRRGRLRLFFGRVFVRLLFLLACVAEYGEVHAAVGPVLHEVRVGREVVVLAVLEDEDAVGLQHALRKHE